MVKFRPTRVKKLLVDYNHQRDNQFLAQTTKQGQSNDANVAPRSPYEAP